MNTTSETWTDELLWALASRIVERKRQLESSSIHTLQQGSVLRFPRERCRAPHQMHELPKET
ncbi:hypothetical protein ABIE09_001740 [Lysobacter enzymogenes]|uniref:hypothetical protein n=1 Tax=Lysobacter enzymogenes TaxID=69 RepID=UPI0033977DBA